MPLTCQGNRRGGLSRAVPAVAGASLAPRGKHLRHVGEIGAKPLGHHQRSVGRKAARHLLAQVRLRQVERRVGVAHIGVGVEEEPQRKIPHVPLLIRALHVGDVEHRRIRLLETSDVIRGIEGHGMGWQVAPAALQIVVIEAAAKLPPEFHAGSVAIRQAVASDREEGEPSLDQINPLRLQRCGRSDAPHVLPRLPAARDRAIAVVHVARERVRDRERKLSRLFVPLDAGPRRRLEELGQPPAGARAGDRGS